MCLESEVGREGYRGRIGVGRSIGRGVEEWKFLRDLGVGTTEKKGKV